MHHTYEKFLNCNPRLNISQFFSRRGITDVETAQTFMMGFGIYITLEELAQYFASNQIPLQENNNLQNNVDVTEIDLHEVESVLSLSESEPEPTKTPRRQKKEN
jgi:hypothetical protein